MNTMRGACRRRKAVAAISINLISGTQNEAAAKKRYLVRLQKTAQDIRTQSVPLS